MTLSMSRPSKHPKTGIYWLRRRVPDDLRALVGKREEKRTLGTRDPDEAKKRHLTALAELEARWANLRSGPRALTEIEAHVLANPIHDWWLAKHRDNPSQQAFWKTAIGEKLFPPILDAALCSIADLRTADEFSLRPDPTQTEVFLLERWCNERADEVLAHNGLQVDDASRRKLAKAVAGAVQRASLSLAKLANGEALQQAHWTPTVGSSVPAQLGLSTTPVRLDDLVKGWAAEAHPAEKTVYEWTRVVGQLATFLGHSDATRIRDEDLIAWKARMVEDGLKPKTIRDAKLAPVRAILQWGVANKRLSANPARGVLIDVRRKASELRRSFDDEEASKILKAALNETNPARRWVPWLCAYSGARVSEVCQLRTTDIVRVDGIWCMKIDPEAGPLKTASSERIVPLHPAVKKAGFQ